MPDIEAGYWHLDKRIPIAMVFAFIAQTVVLVVIGTSWKVGVDARLYHLEKLADDRQDQEARVIVMEQKLQHIIETLDRLEAALEAKK